MNAIIVLIPAVACLIITTVLYKDKISKGIKSLKNAFVQRKHVSDDTF
jgi:hypothetical protein